MDHFNTNRIDFFETELATVEPKNTYLKYWLEIMMEHDIAVTALIKNKPKAHIYAGKILRKALKFQNTPAVLAIAQEFPRYLIFSNSGINVDYYIGLVKKHQFIYQAELDAKMFSAEINLDFSRKVKNKRLLNKLDGFISILEAYAKTVDSYDFQKYFYELKLKKFQLVNDDQGILEVGHAAAAVMKAKRFNVAPQVSFYFDYVQIPILIKKGEFNIAKKLIKKWQNIVKPGENNYFSLLSFYIILLFRMEDISRVKRVLSKIHNFPNPIIRERFELYNSYLEIFGKKSSLGDSFLNYVYEHQKDKSGYNISIVIAQFLHLLKVGDDQSRDKYIESVESVKRYSYRHIKEEKRSWCFIQMLLMVPKCNFEKGEFIKKSKRHLNQLNELPIEKHSQSIEVEMVPYEALYNKVLDFLN